MILIAPDKYRGTMTATTAARIMAEILPGKKLVVPMADGGEGTACAIARDSGWRSLRHGVYISEFLNEVALDSSAVVGYGAFCQNDHPMDRTTAKLGELLNDLYIEYRPRTIYIGIGGTATCDGGVGMLDALNPDIPWANILMGIIDVKVSLLPAFSGAPSALMFCPQKGFTDADMPYVEKRLRQVVELYGPEEGLYGGAGGGLGYALESVIGAECHSGAQWLLARARIPWERIDFVITGEGCFDSQSVHGKVVTVLAKEASRHGVPTYCFAGAANILNHGVKNLTVIDMSKYLTDNNLTSETAKRRLVMALNDFKNGL